MRTTSHMNGKRKISKTSSKLPFEERTISNSSSIRKFSASTDDEDFIWHRDKENRIIEVLSGESWMFQHDNYLPKKISAGDVLFINKNEWHRVIKGSSDLIVKITKF